MIQPLPHWLSRFAACAYEAALPYPADVSVMAAAVATEALGGKLSGAAAPEELVTAEGEHAVLMTAWGTERRQLTQVDVGYVLLDDRCSRFTAVCRIPELFGRVTRAARRVVVGDAHGLGVRPRRVAHRAPAGWQAAGAGLARDWLAPDGTAAIAVGAAIPSAASGPDCLAGLLAHASGGLARSVEPCASRAGLRGVSGGFVLPGAAGVRRDVVLLGDGTYLYSARLDQRGEHRAARRAFAAVIRSLRPVPRAAGDAGVAVEHWLG